LTLAAARNFEKLSALQDQSIAMNLDTSTYAIINCAGVLA
jgi:hypothetical protein